MMCCASVGPIPGRDPSSVSVAVLRLIFAPSARPPPVPRPRPPRVDRPEPRGGGFPRPWFRPRIGPPPRLGLRVGLRRASTDLGLLVVVPPAVHSGLRSGGGARPHRVEPPPRLVLVPPP